MFCVFCDKFVASFLIINFLLIYKVLSQTNLHSLWRSEGSDFPSCLLFFLELK